MEWDDMGNETQVHSEQEHVNKSVSTHKKTKKSKTTVGNATDALSSTNNYESLILPSEDYLFMNVSKVRDITPKSSFHRHLKHRDKNTIQKHRWLHIQPHSSFLPYDWGYGYYAYLIGISAVFMGVIILEGVDTSIMCKSAPSKLNSTFWNVGLLATLVGTMGRVLGDGMITLGALFGLSSLQSFAFMDFVNLLFLPLIPLTLLCFYLTKRYYRSLT